MDDKAKKRAEAREFQLAITEQWKAIFSKYPEAVADYISYIDGLSTFYRYCAEEQEMHGVILDDHKVSQMLQQARTCDTVKTYITSRMDSNVAQPIKNSK